ncbi:RagB/SusD family nutrient uptake outer membrane protein [Chitinophaga agri]|uniref:SusD-like N-terminal domain-containing protein n=1 Tax=Chitinophaga agri TaxID=2703787 RepID=A0A6B9ZH98_9BACT|nr:RagB/SusD family nutrient uptake outer membrane protein [Chitinophaga agri]QHS61828.1 hypothetical protein GWR21_20145 [Chitinophaga agri]
MKKLLFPVLLCGLFACKKDKEEPVAPATSSLRITVWDGAKWYPGMPKGTESQQATVQLFSTRKDYLNKKPAYTAKVNIFGVAEFKSAAPGTYYIVAFDGDKTNTWDDGKGHTMVADSLFQTEKEITAPETPFQAGAHPGDFRFKDLNMDMIINGNDVAEAPFDSVALQEGASIEHSVIIGFKSNYESTLYKLLSEIESELSYTATNINSVTQIINILDGMLSDDADCSNLPDWCELDNFTFNAYNSQISNVWVSSYYNITRLNTLQISLDRMQVKYPETTAQIKALRAYIYLTLQTYFGGIPTIDGRIVNPDLTRKSLQDTRAYIKKELTDALPALPAVNSSEKQWQITSYTAHMLLARLAFQESDIEALIEHTNAVISSKGFSLADPAAIFDSPANSEVIWNISRNLYEPFKTYFVRGNNKVNFCPIIRYTETLLLSGYGKVMMNDLDGSTSVINAIRARSKKAAIYPKNMDEAIAELGTLYKEELYREGFRYAFLVLTNQAKEVLGSKGYKDHHNLMPIPANYLNNYPNMTQNAGYN